MTTLRYNPKRRAEFEEMLAACVARTGRAPRFLTKALCKLWGVVEVDSLDDRKTELYRSWFLQVKKKRSRSSKAQLPLF